MIETLHRGTALAARVVKHKPTHVTVSEIDAMRSLSLYLAGHFRPDTTTLYSFSAALHSVLNSAVTRRVDRFGVSTSTSSKMRLFLDRRESLGSVCGVTHTRFCKSLVHRGCAA